MNWEIARISDVCEVIMGQSPPSNYYNTEKKGLPFYQGKLEFGDISPTTRKWCSKPLKIAQKNDILLSVRAPVGPTNICQETACIGRGLAAIRYFFNDAYKFVFYYLRSIESQLANIGTGSTFSAISKSQISNLQIPIPPLPEQRRIVAKIEELFTRLDAGVEALKKIKTQLKRYRQAVLKYAFEGKLTQQWREAHKEELEPASVLLERIKEQRKKEAKGKFKELPPVDTSELPELPEGWLWTRLGEISEIIMGQSPPSSTYNENENGLPFYQGKLEFGNFYPTPRKWCSSPKKIAEKGDVLISVRAPVGPTNICPERSCIGRGLASIRILGGIKTLFILYLMRAFEQKIANQGTGTTFNAIKVDQLKNIEIPLSPLNEQDRILEEVERRFSIADNLEKIVEQSLKQSERLRQSILKRAFEGKLVPQDPTDEPASVLLERIKSNRQLKTKKVKYQKEKGLCQKRQTNG